MRRNIVHDKNAKFFLTGITRVESLEPGYLPLKKGESYLLGDWKQANGQWEIDPNGPEGFSAIVKSNGFIEVENSHWLTWCSENKDAVMSDGRQCGDLDVSGGYGMAYSLPPDFYKS